MPFIVNEDAALKIALQGMTVFDQNSGPNGRNVLVRFQLPEDEVSDLMFPIVVIKPQGWGYAPERQHDGYIQIPYAPEGLDGWWGADQGQANTSFNPDDSPYQNWFPTAINMDYEIVVYSRNVHLHTIPIESQLAAYGRLHPRFAHLNIPQDGTIRTAILEAGPERDYEHDNNGKRLITSNYRLRVFSELLAPFVVGPYGNTPVTQIYTTLGVDLGVYVDEADITDLTKTIGIIATTGTSSWNTQTR